MQKISKAEYHSYLLRLWKEAPNAPWRASLHCTQTREWLHFAEIADLLAFLQAQTTDLLPDEDPPHPS